MFEVPTSLSPSRVEAFTSCPMAFRFASIERIADPPTIHTTRGSLVHRALELAFAVPAHRRDDVAFIEALDRALDEYATDPDFTQLGLSDDATTKFRQECRKLVDNYLAMEDPTQVNPVGIELRLSADVDGLTLRGIIDRLELRAGELVVTDYKTGRAPSANWEQKSLNGVHFYSLLCQQVFGRLPVAIRLMYLRSGEIIEARPSEQSVRFVRSRTSAVWKAVARACEHGDFKPHPSALCGSCRYQPWCPAFGGDPELARVEAPVAFSQQNVVAA